MLTHQRLCPGAFARQNGGQYILMIELGTLNKGVFLLRRNAMQDQGSVRQPRAAFIRFHEWHHAMHSTARQFPQGCDLDLHFTDQHSSDFRIGFNLKAPRHTICPVGSNAPSTLQSGFVLVKPADDIRRTMPDWEEPPIHMDLVILDATVTAGNNRLIDKGLLCAFRDPEVIAMAQNYGAPLKLLEALVF